MAEDAPRVRVRRDPLVELRADVLGAHHAGTDIRSTVADRKDPRVSWHERAGIMDLVERLELVCHIDVATKCRKSRCVLSKSAGRGKSAGGAFRQQNHIEDVTVGLRPGLQFQRSVDRARTHFRAVAKRDVRSDRRID